MLKERLISIIALLLICASPAYAIDEINKKLELKENFSHLLTFDEKIIRYKAGNDSAFNIEIMPDIYNTRHEMLIKPLVKINTNLLVWTESRVYNFDIKVKGINKGYEGFDYFEIDLPPGLN
ncbi:MAG: hypothetical protein A2Y25_07940 [Candidatus Melainabacteria bacterium GWF2_37_15]|nr:MAG: hypothetical protein A2Y25_07940 [Candidatus Melainabacteria bacterium GWF2_37_15]